MPDPQLTFHGRTDVGIVRDHNEDAFGFFLPEGQAPGDSGATGTGGDLIAVVSDGVGGHEAGELASNATVAGVGAVLSQIACELDPADLERLKPRLDKAMAGLNTNLRSVARHRGQGKKNMAATLTAAWLAAGRLILVHAGDSRLYRWRAGKLEQLTIDDTKAGRAIAKGRATEEQARADASWHVIERAMGVEERKFAVTVESFEVQDGDVYLLCSDGLTSGLSNKQLEKGFGRLDPGDLTAFNERLIEAGNQASGKDNITTALVAVPTGWVAASQEPANRPFIKQGSSMHSKHIYPLYALIVASILGLAALAYSHYKSGNAAVQTRNEQMEALESFSLEIEEQLQKTDANLRNSLTRHEGKLVVVDKKLSNLDGRLGKLDGELGKLGQESQNLEIELRKSQAASARQNEATLIQLTEMGERVAATAAATQTAHQKAASVSAQLDSVWTKLDELSQAKALFEAAEKIPAEAETAAQEAAETEAAGQAPADAAVAPEPTEEVADAPEVSGEEAKPLTEQEPAEVEGSAETE